MGVREDLGGRGGVAFEWFSHHQLPPRVPFTSAPVSTAASDRPGMGFRASGSGFRVLECRRFVQCRHMISDRVSS